MYQAVVALLTRQADLMDEGRTSELTGDFVFPCPFQIEDRLVVLHAAADLADLLSKHRASYLQRSGLPRFVPHVPAIELPRRGRFRAWVRWAHHFEDRVVENASNAIYFLHQREGGGLAIEMVDYTRLSHNDVKAFRPSRRKAC